MSCWSVGKRTCKPNEWTLEWPSFPLASGFSMEIFLFLVGHSFTKTFIQTKWSDMLDWVESSVLNWRKCIVQTCLLSAETIPGYFVQFAASCILLYKIWKHKSIYGLSIDTQACCNESNCKKNRTIWIMPGFVLKVINLNTVQYVDGRSQTSCAVSCLLDRQVICWLS